MTDDIDDLFGDYCVTIICRERTKTFLRGFEMVTDYRNGEVLKMNFDVHIHNHDIKIKLIQHNNTLFAIARLRPYGTVRMPPENFICEICLKNKVNCTGRQH